MDNNLVVSKRQTNKYMDFNILSNSIGMLFIIGNFGWVVAIQSFYLAVLEKKQIRFRFKQISFDWLCLFIAEKYSYGGYNHHSSHFKWFFFSQTV